MRDHSLRIQCKFWLKPHKTFPFQMGSHYGNQQHTGVHHKAATLQPSKKSNKKQTSSSWSVLQNSLQLQLCISSFGTCCQLDQILDPVEAITPKPLFFT